MDKNIPLLCFLWLIVSSVLITATSCIWVSEKEISGTTGTGGEESIVVFGKSHTLTDGEIWLPTGITVDNNNNVYVCSGEGQITKFNGNDRDDFNTDDRKSNSQRRFIKRWKSACHGLEADSNGNIYVATGYRWVDVYDPNGNHIRTIGGPDSSDGELKGVKDVAVDDGRKRVYVLDSLNFRIAVFDTDGSFLFKWYPEDTGGQPFGGPRGPYGIAVDEKTGDVYVADTEAHRIQKFDKDGKFILMWGQEGNKTGDIKFPRDIEVDSDGYVYVADTDTERIQIFDPNENFIMEFQGPQNEIDSSFHPRSVAVNHQTGEIFVAAAYAHRIDKFKKFDPNSLTSKFTWDETNKPGHRARKNPNDPSTEGQGSENYLYSWGWLEKGNGILRFPQAIAIGEDKYIYIADTMNTLIQKFDTNGNFIKHWGCSGRIYTPYLGGIDGHPCFDFPINITADNDGNVYQLQIGSDYGGDPQIKRVQKFDRDGQLLENWRYENFTEGMMGIAYNPYNNYIYVSNTPNNMIQYFNKTDGTDPTGNETNSFSFSSPTRIAADGITGDIYAVDTTNYQIHKFTKEGDFLLKWGKKGEGDGEFKFDINSGIFVDRNGYVYVADTYNYRIQVFDGNGNFLLKWGKFGDRAGDFYSPIGIVVDSKGYIYVLDIGNGNIQKFAPIQLK